MSKLEVDMEALEAKMKEVAPENAVQEAKEEPEIAQQEEKAVLEASPLEELAKKHGWNPNGEKSAEDFIAFALDKYPKRGKELKDLRKTVDHLVDLNKKQHQAGYEKAMVDLQNKRRDAIFRGDVAEVDMLDQQIQQQQQEAAQLDPAAGQQVHPALLEFDARHKDWIADNVSLTAHKMRNFAMMRGEELAKSGMDPVEWVDILEQNLQEEFPSYFNPKQVEKVQMYPAVDQDTSSGTVKQPRSKPKFSFNDLNADQQAIAKQFERRGVMKTDEYIKQLVEIGELK